jgi:predicted MFS family arabinose efflux permease
MRGYSMAVVGITSIIFQGFLVKYVRKILTDIGMMLTGLLILSLGMFLYVINPIALLLFAIVILFPLGMGMFNPSLASQLSQSSPHHSGRVMGLNTSMTGVG